MTNPALAARPPFLSVDGINKFFGAHHVLRDVSFEVARGEVVALLGPSGSGKTTLLRVLQGFESPDLGRILVDGAPVHEEAPARRGFGMVFQSYALFPHLTVGENVAFGLAANRMARARIAERVREVLALVELHGFENRRVAEVSGGQQQRVALARALAPLPRLLLLDEPLSNLDPALRERTRRLLRNVMVTTGITSILVTHEQEEAFELGDRIGVLNEGRLEQLAAPEELYEVPASRFVASFIGRSSLLQGILEESSPTATRVRLLGGGDASGVLDWPAQASPDLVAGDAVDVLVRPEGLRFAEAEEPGAAAGRVCARRFAGPFAYYEVALDVGPSVEVIGASRAASVTERCAVVPRPRPLPRLFLRTRGEA